MRTALVAVGIALGLVALFLLVRALRALPRATDGAGPSGTGVDRRRFLNRTLIGSLSLFAVAMGAGSAAFLWPKVRTGAFGSKIVAGRYKDLLHQLKVDGKPIYNLTGKFYVIRYDGKDIDEFYSGAGVLAGGLMAIFQKCSHLGCRVPYCPTSGWFECPCHDARFNEAGEVKRGPAPAGLWRFPIEIDSDGYVVVDTSRRIAQPPAGYDSMGTQPKGAFCVN